MSPFLIATTATCALAIAMGIGRFAFTPLLPLMQDDGLLSIQQGGLLASVHFLGYLLGALYAGRLPFSPRFTLRFSLIAIGISTLGMGLTGNFYIWCLLRWLAGFCSALTLVLISNYSVKRLAELGHVQKQGWIFSGVGAGIALAGLGALAIMIWGAPSDASWQIFGILSLVAAFAVSVNTGSELPDQAPGKRVQSSKQSRLVWHLIIPYGALGIGYIIPATYLPVMAREIIPSPLIFGWAWPLFGAAAFASTLMAARLQRDYSARQIWVVGQVIMAAGLLLPVVYPHLFAIIAAGICVGGTFMVITMMGMKETHRIAPPADIMRHLAAMTAAFAIGQMIGPVFASSLYEMTGSFAASLVLASVALVATTLCLRIDPSPNPAD